jgi:EAL domain-containing protein (putative c-di-GMP-specific phosphodiesterase class I)
MEKTNTAKQITFEIVESEGIESFTEVSNFIKKAKKLGCKIAMMTLTGILLKWN